MIMLHAWTKRYVTLAGAFGVAPEVWRKAEPVALLYTPACCQLARVRGDGSLESMDDGGELEKVDLTAAFEARAFCEMGELRWLHEGAGTGRGVFLSEAGAVWNGWESQYTIEALEKDRGQYLLWGEGWVPKADPAGGHLSGLPPSWSWLATSRIGKLEVPVEGIGSGDRVCLLYEEYYGLDLGPAGKDHGNVVVLEERLLGLQKAKTPGQREGEVGKS